MTFEELKQEAKRQGYNLTKAEPYIRFMPCTCGFNRRRVCHSPEGYEFECMRCGKTGGIGATEKQAKQFWNEMIIAEMEQKK